MKKQTQYSDKYGKIVGEGEVVEERKSPGVTLSPEPEAAPEEVAEEVVEDAEEVAEEEAPKASKKSKKSDDE